MPPDPRELDLFPEISGREGPRPKDRVPNPRMKVEADEPERPIVYRRKSTRTVVKDGIKQEFFDDAGGYFRLSLDDESYWETT